MMSTGILLFLTCVIIIFFIQQHYNEEYLDTRNAIKEKERIHTGITNDFNTVFLEIRGYIAFGDEKMKENALDQEKAIREKTAALKGAIETPEEQAVYQEIADFTDYYFLDVLPDVFSNPAAAARALSAESSSSVRAAAFRESSVNHQNEFEKQLEDNIGWLRKHQTNIQILSIFCFLGFLLLFQKMFRTFIRNIGKPLADFASAANEIAGGKDAVIRVSSSREDELGALAHAFHKMITSVQDKEQDLVAQNEELQAQQDELQAQQKELEEALEFLRENDRQLTQRNGLINSISTSLNKQKVLNSIVESMTVITSSEKGLVILGDAESLASYGIADTGVKQFIEYYHNGLNTVIKSGKKPMALKRAQDPAEMGFHETKMYSYDLYLPVINTYDSVEALMIFCRYGDPFTDKEIEEYSVLAKQIAISLDKIKLYEQSEFERQLNHDILNTVQEGIQLIGLNGDIIHANDMLAQIFCLPDEAAELAGLSGSAWISRFNDRTEEDLERLLERAAAPGTAEEDRSFTYTIKESGRVYKAYCVPISMGAGNKGILLVHRDITKEHEVDKMKSEFVSTVSHELRTPLASILGFTELMLHKDLKEERKNKYLRTIYNEANRLTALINDFLDVQRMESGKQLYARNETDILPLLKKTADQLKETASNHQFTFSSDCDEAIIWGDREKLRQVFINVIGNAVKYSPDGGRIGVEVQLQGQNICIRIQDEGLGIPEEALPKLFQKFYRIDNSDRRSIGGTGLGLSIAEEVVKAHNGTITAESQEGHGAIFTICLPEFSA